MFSMKMKLQFYAGEQWSWDCLGQCDVLGDCVSGMHAYVVTSRMFNLKNASEFLNTLILVGSLLTSISK